MKDKSMTNLLSRIRVQLGDTYRLVKENLQVPLDFLYDAAIYSRWSGTFSWSRTQRTLQAYIIRMYHGIEVGLSYPDPKPGFGMKTVNRLVSALEKYAKKYQLDFFCKIALNVLQSYVEFNHKLGIEFENLNRRLQALHKQVPAALQGETGGGYINIKSTDIFLPGEPGFAHVIATRHSFRQYTSAPVDMAIIEKAVQMAIQSPSACNRQPVRVHVLQDKVVRDKILKLQNNQRGWRDQPDKMLLVTSSVEFYRESRERYAPFIDGGLFAMTLVWALHAQGVGTCCLNLNLDRAGIRRLKKAAGLHQADVPIMLIAAGMLPEENTVAVSTRRSVDQVMRIL
ncbi:MAG TPA: nitroreductase family protein [bacterium]|nr:nitroreductase family protein [bacterium]HPN42102.1 nitroreductase family protein [bacterium]